MIDIHCHILPDLDDGASCLADSIAMANQAIADGIHTIVATPHTLNGKYQNTYHRIAEAVRQFQSLLSDDNLDLSICPGSDVHMCQGLTEQVLDGEIATINNTMRYILVEFPVQAIPEGAKDELFKLKLNGITPIITHPERNMVLQYDMALLHELIAMGCLVQITAMSITGGFGNEAMESAHHMLKLGMTHIIASDAHSPGGRPPVLSSAVEVAAEIIKSKTEALKMVVDRPQAVIDGKAIRVPEPLPPEEKKWWRFWA